jgi:DNA invertase Pin-like site-specific DNA recombinase
MKQGVIYARVSSKGQEREGFSIPAQLKMLREYALKNRVLREFVDVETAKTAGRKQVGEMVHFFEKTPLCRIVIVEKTDRLYRNFNPAELLLLSSQKPFQFLTTPARL